MFITKKYFNANRTSMVKTRSIFNSKSIINPNHFIKTKSYFSNSKANDEVDKPSAVNDFMNDGVSYDSDSGYDTDDGDVLTEYVDNNGNDEGKSTTNPLSHNIAKANPDTIMSEPTIDNIANDESNPDTEESKHDTEETKSDKEESKPQKKTYKDMKMVKPTLKKPFSYIYGITDSKGDVISFGKGQGVKSGIDNAINRIKHDTKIVIDKNNIGNLNSDGYYEMAIVSEGEPITVRIKTAEYKEKDLPLKKGQTQADAEKTKEALADKKAADKEAEKLDKEAEKLAKLAESAKKEAEEANAKAELRKLNSE